MQPLYHRAILWSTSAEDQLKRWYSENENVDVHVYPEKGKYCVVNNSYKCQETTIYTEEGEPLPLSVNPGEILWYNM